MDKLPKKNTKAASNKKIAVSNSNKKNTKNVQKSSLKKSSAKSKPKQIKETVFVSRTPDDTMEHFKDIKQKIDLEHEYVTKRSKGKKSVKSKKQNVKKKNPVKTIFIVATSIIIVLAIIILVLMFSLSCFNINSIQITGTDKYTSEDVANTLNITEGENIFKVYFFTNKENLSKNFPYIGKFEFDIGLPNTLYLKVTENESTFFAFNKENSKYYKLTEDGYILEEFDNADLRESEVLVSGITFDNNVVLGSVINEVDLNRMKKFIQFSKSLYANLDDINITRVTFVNNYMKIYINSKIEVVFEIDKELQDYSISMLKLIMQNVGELSGTIDMTRENPTFVRN